MAGWRGKSLAIITGGVWVWFGDTCGLRGVMVGCVEGGQRLRSSIQDRRGVLSATAFEFFTRSTRTLSVARRRLGGRHGRITKRTAEWRVHAEGLVGLGHEREKVVVLGLLFGFGVFAGCAMFVPGFDGGEELAGIGQARKFVDIETA